MDEKEFDPEFDSPDGDDNSCDGEDLSTLPAEEGDSEDNEDDPDETEDGEEYTAELPFNVSIEEYKTSLNYVDYANLKDSLNDFHNKLSEIGYKMKIYINVLAEAWQDDILDSSDFIESNITSYVDSIINNDSKGFYLQDYVDILVNLIQSMKEIDNSIARAINDESF